MPTTATAASISTLAMIIGIILLAGTIRGAILLIKDAMKHKKFAKVIRWICAIVQFVSLLCSIIVVILLLADPTNLGAGMGAFITFVLSFVSILSIIASVWGGILLFIQSSRVKGFAKIIRIVCGILMIIALFSSLMVI